MKRTRNTEQINQIHSIKTAVTPIPRVRAWIACTLVAASLVALAIPLKAQDCRQGCNNDYATTWHGIGALENNATGYGNSAFGFWALLSNTNGLYNTAVGEGSLTYNSTGSSNTAVGNDALHLSTTGVGNTAVGSLAMAAQQGGTSYNTALGYLALDGGNVGTGSYNTASGAYALTNITTGANNTANGYNTLSNNSSGTYNTASGAYALTNNTTGANNTATGANAMQKNTVGRYNTAYGYDALFSNDYAWGNTAIGDGALFGNVSGYYNTATGEYALNSNTSGGYNVASGFSALDSNTTGSGNTATGSSTLFSNTTGGTNCAFGNGALSRNTTASNNTAVGFNSLSNNISGGNNIALGDSAGLNLTTGTFNIDIGNKGVAGETGTIRIGKKPQNTATYIAGISGTTVAGGVGVLIDNTGRLGTVVSSERFKDRVKPMGRSSEAILSLKPVTFHYKHDLDPDGIPQFGLVAEQVEKVNPDLVARDEQGKAYTVRYEAVNAMLLNEFLKEHRKVEEQQASIAELKSILAQQEKAHDDEIMALRESLKEQAVHIQKVSDQLKAQQLVVVSNR